MDTLNNNPAETEVPASTPAPIASAPEAAAAPVTAPAPAAAPAATPAPAVKMELPKTDGKTVGGWNRFAGYNPNAPKKNDKGRGDSRGRR